MISSFISLALVQGISALALTSPYQGYVYIPTDYEPGFDSRATANITLGTDPAAKSIKVVMDTGSNDFWTWAPNAIIRWGSPYLFVVGNCNETVPTRYDPATSPTSHVINKTASYAYAGNSKLVFSNTTATDTFTPIGGSGPVRDIQVALGDRALLKLAASDECIDPGYDEGIIGLSPVHNTSVGPSFRETLYNTKQIASKTMVMWFNKYPGGVQAMRGGTLFGAIDTSKFVGPLVRVPFMTTSRQIGVYVSVPTIKFGNETFNLTADNNCLVDSGAHGDSLPFSFLSTDEARFLHASGGKLISSGLFAWNDTCASIPEDLKISYTFAGVKEGQNVTIEVPIRNYAREGDSKSAGHTVCYLNLEPTGCVFGAPFSSAAFLALDESDSSVALAQGGVAPTGSGLDVFSLRTIERNQKWEDVL